MLSELAKNDINALQQSGCVLTAEEIVELNDLACEIEMGKYTTPQNHPRIAFANNTPIHEPTVGSQIWFDDFGRDSTTNDGLRFYVYMFSLAHARNIELLDSLEEPKKIVKAVKKWMKTLECTESELWRALVYVKFGSKIPTQCDNEEQDTDYKYGSDLVWSMVISASSATGISIEDLRTMTTGDVSNLLVQANIRAHIPMKRSVADLYIRYRQLLKKIEDRTNG